MAPFFVHLFHCPPGSHALLTACGVACSGGDGPAVAVTGDRGTATCPDCLAAPMEWRKRPGHFETNAAREERHRKAEAKKSQPDQPPGV